MIRLEKVSKIFGTGVAGLSDIDLLIEKGEFVFLVGHTGSGKTTLLRLLVRDTLPTSGTIIVSDFDVVKLPANRIPHLRKKVGVIFQDLKLLVDRTIVENIILPMQVAGVSLVEATKRAEDLLEQVGLMSHKDKFPVQLSGGELQRVAIARALALSPEILLADEPTGNLDPATAMEIVDLLQKINEMGTTIVMATHNLEIVEKLHKRVVALDKGKLIKDTEKHSSAAKDEDKKGEDEKKAASDAVEKDASADSQDGKNETSNVTKEDETSSSTKAMEDKEEKNSSVSSPQDEKKDDKLEEHKKESRKLSDLLAKARHTLQNSHKHGGHNVTDLPFGFTKEADAKKSEETQ